MKKFGFTIIIPTHNAELGIRDSIESVIKQTLDFNENVEIIIVDNNSEDATENICREYADQYPENIKFHQQGKYDLNEAKNIGIEQSKGDFIGFLENHDYLSHNALTSVLNFIKHNEEVDLISIPLVHFKNGQKINYLNHKIKKTMKINLLKQPKYVQFIGLSTFFKRDSVKSLGFLNAYNSSITLFSEILINNPILGICKEGTYYSNNIDEKIYATKQASFDLEEYDKFLKWNLKFLIEKSMSKFAKVPQFIQYNLINHLRWLLAIEKTQISYDLDELIENIRHIHDDIILDNMLLEHEHKVFTCLLKYGNDLNEPLKEKLGLNTIFIDNYDIIEDKLHILASMLHIEPETVDIMVNGHEVNKKELRFPQKDEYSLGHKYLQDYSIQTVIPLSVDEKTKLEFERNNKNLHIDFSRPCNFSKSVGYAKTRHYLSILNNDEILIEKKTNLKWIKEEAKSLINMIKKHEPGFEKAIPFRIAYMIGYPFLKDKRIWFYMDRPDESDDNGLALFKYAVKKDDDISRYFILSKKAKEFDNVKKIGKVIPFKSIRHRYLGLFVENIITSHPDNEIIYPFWGGYPFFAGLLRSNNIFLQHGILKDNISSWLNKSNMNLSFFLVSSDKEYESIFKLPYNYDKDIVQLLGLPRYDTLQNREDKKQIVIMPSWRRDLDHKSKEYVKDNEFFKRFNSLINNEKLIQKAKELGYEIIFRPHPKVYSYIDLFNKNDYVKIDYDKVKYQTLFNNGSLMITDYSSVAFDFAYLYKPVLYYQYGDDYHFDLDDSYYNYKTMGFGEIVNTEEELVNLVIEYMENDCKLKEEHCRRIKDFFYFTDRNNCKRVHNKINEIPLKD